MNNILMTAAVHFISKLVKGMAPMQSGGADPHKLKMAIWYLHGVKSLRLLFISLLGSGLCLILLLAGLVLIHYTILVYAPWDAGVKITFTLISGAFYICVAAAIFSYLFAEEQWFKIFEVRKVISELTGEVKTDEQLKSHS